MGFIEVRLSTKRNDFVSLNCGTYFMEDNTVQYSTTVVITYDNTLQPMFPPNPFECSGDIVAFSFFLIRHR